MTETLNRRPYFLAEIEQRHIAAVSEFLKTVDLETLHMREHLDIAIRHRKGARLTPRQVRWMLNEYDIENYDVPEPLKLIDVKTYAELDLIDAVRSDEVKRLKALIKMRRADTNLNAKVAMLFGLPANASVLADEGLTIGIAHEGKTCKQCSHFKLYSEFNHHASSRDGYETKCKVCRYGAA